MDVTLALPPEGIELILAVKEMLSRSPNPNSEILELWKGVGTAYSGLWTFYVVGASATLGYVFSDKFVKIAHPAKIALFALFAVFALANLVSVLQNLMVYNAATNHVVASLKSIASQPASASASARSAGTIQAIADSFCVTPWWIVLPLHLAVDACILRIVCLRARAPDPDNTNKQTSTITAVPGGA